MTRVRPAVPAEVDVEGGQVGAGGETVEGVAEGVQQLGCLLPCLVDGVHRSGEPLRAASGDGPVHVLSPA